MIDEDVEVPIFLVDVEGCAWCGQDHENLTVFVNHLTASLHTTCPGVSKRLEVFVVTGRLKTGEERHD